MKHSKSNCILISILLVILISGFTTNNANAVCVNGYGCRESSNPCCSTKVCRYKAKSGSSYGHCEKKQKRWMPMPMLKAHPPTIKYVTSEAVRIDGKLFVRVEAKVQTHSRWGLTDPDSYTPATIIKKIQSPGDEAIAFISYIDKSVTYMKIEQVLMVQIGRTPSEITDNIFVFRGYIELEEESHVYNLKYAVTALDQIGISTYTLNGKTPTVSICPDKTDDDSVIENETLCGTSPFLDEVSPPVNIGEDSYVACFGTPDAVHLDYDIDDYDIDAFDNPPSDSECSLFYTVNGEENLSSSYSNIDIRGINAGLAYDKLSVDIELFSRFADPETAGSEFYDSDDFDSVSVYVYPAATSDDADSIFGQSNDAGHGMLVYTKSNSQKFNGDVLDLSLTYGMSNIVWHPEPLFVCALRGYVKNTLGTTNFPSALKYAATVHGKDIFHLGNNSTDIDWLCSNHIDYEDMISCFENDSYYDLELFYYDKQWSEGIDTMNDFFEKQNSKCKTEFSFKRGSMANSSAEDDNFLFMTMDVNYNDGNGYVDVIGGYNPGVTFFVVTEHNNFDVIDLSPPLTIYENSLDAPTEIIEETDVDEQANATEPRNILNVNCNSDNREDDGALKESATCTAAGSDDPLGTDYCFLYWEPVEDANDYEVFRYESGSQYGADAADFVGRINVNSYTDEKLKRDGVSYKYFIRPRKATRAVTEYAEDDTPVYSYRINYIGKSNEVTCNVSQAPSEDERIYAPYKDGACCTD